MSSNKEVWKEIPGYEGHYQASDKGNIRSLDRVVPWTDSDFVQKRKGILLRQSKDKGGYNAVTLTLHRKREKGLVHRLVGKTFIPNPENKPEINHIDGVRDNNNLKNLEWVTSQENTQHSWENLGMENPRNIPIKCLTHEIECISMREMGRELARRGFATEGSYRMLSYHYSKGKQKFKYKGMEFEMIENVRQ